LLLNDIHIVGFLDCKIDETCTLGFVLFNNEELAERHPGAEIIQRVLYTGCLKIHGLKVLTVVFPNGIIAYLYGPISAWENDIGLPNLSWLNKHWIALQLEIAAAWANEKDILFFSMNDFPYLQCLHMHMSLL